nr:hypothetical protein [Mucilaginibacter sp. E4BP6]
MDHKISSDMEVLKKKLASIDILQSTTDPKNISVKQY